jgi:acetyltransferase-like isoleucine patch superfamily enzyme
MLLARKHDYDKIMQERQDSIFEAPILIKKGAWIGSGAIILGGITVGENAVVGAGSIVTKDVPDNAIVARNPAKLIKYIGQK